MPHIGERINKFQYTSTYGILFHNKKEANLINEATLMYIKVIMLSENKNSIKSDILHVYF